MSEKHQIVVLGGNIAGVNVAQYLLRHTIPALESTMQKPATYKVILVSTSTHMYWTVGAPRALVSSALVPVDRPFSPIRDAFSKHSAKSFEFFHAEATSLDTSRRSISLRPLESSPNAPKSLGYTTLVLATGSSSTSPLWSTAFGHDKTQAAFDALHAALPAASTIVVAGGGPAGVETAGELGSAFHSSKKITLISGSSRLLPGARNSLGAGAEKFLHEMGVNIMHHVRVSGSALVPGTQQTTLKLSNGSTLVTDVFIDATGLKPNTAYLPAELVDERGAVINDARTLRVLGAGPRVYALGSVASYSNGSLLDIWDAMGPLMANIAFDLSDGRIGKEKSFARRAETLIVPVGRSKGVGVAWGWLMPSSAVWIYKGRTYMFDELKQEKNGGKYLRPA